MRVAEVVRVRRPVLMGVAMTVGMLAVIGLRPSADGPCGGRATGGLVGGHNPSAATPEAAIASVVGGQERLTIERIDEGRYRVFYGEQLAYDHVQVAEGPQGFTMGEAAICLALG